MHHLYGLLITLSLENCGMHLTMKDTEALFTSYLFRLAMYVSFLLNVSTQHYVIYPETPLKKIKSDRKSSLVMSQDRAMKFVPSSATLFLYDLGQVLNSLHLSLPF